MSATGFTFTFSGRSGDVWFVRTNVFCTALSCVVNDHQEYRPEWAAKPLLLSRISYSGGERWASAFALCGPAHRSSSPRRMVDLLERRPKREEASSASVTQARPNQQTDREPTGVFSGPGLLSDVHAQARLMPGTP